MKDIVVEHLLISKCVRRDSRRKIYSHYSNPTPDLIGIQKKEDSDPHPAQLWAQLLSDCGRLFVCLCNVTVRHWKKFIFEGDQNPARYGSRGVHSDYSNYFYELHSESNQVAVKWGKNRVVCNIDSDICTNSGQSQLTRIGTWV